MEHFINGQQWHQWNYGSIEHQMSISINGTPHQYYNNKKKTMFYQKIIFIIILVDYHQKFFDKIIY